MMYFRLYLILAQKEQESFRQYVPLATEPKSTSTEVTVLMNAVNIKKNANGTIGGVNGINCSLIVLL